MEFMHPWATIPFIASSQSSIVADGVHASIGRGERETKRQHSSSITTSQSVVQGKKSESENKEQTYVTFIPGKGTRCHFQRRAPSKVNRAAENMTRSRVHIPIRQRQIHHLHLCPPLNIKNPPIRMRRRRKPQRVPGAINRQPRHPVNRKRGRITPTSTQRNLIPQQNVRIIRNRRR